MGGAFFNGLSLQEARGDDGRMWICSVSVKNTILIGEHMAQFVAETMKDRTNVLGVKVPLVLDDLLLGRSLSSATLKACVGRTLVDASEVVEIIG